MVEDPPVAPPVTIIGMGASPDDLTARQHSAIAAATLLVGGKRHLDPFGHLDCQRRVIDKDLKGLGDFLADTMAGHTIVVLTSGDPLFYGIGAFLIRRLGNANVRILPNVSTVAAAFARLGEPWQDIRVVSLHGRSHTGELLHYLAAGDTVAVFTDATHDPAWLAALLEENRFPDATLVVLERLGMPDETISRLTPSRARSMTFAELNLVVLKPDADRQTAPAIFPGMPDDWFVHARGMITKADVRAVSLSRLRLFDRAVLWDLGAGSGSVSIEAGGVIVRGTIWAVEQNPERIDHIHENRRRFGIGNLQVLQARLPDGLAELPDPDRIFVGGGGRSMADIVHAAAGRLKPKGVIVVNTVLIDNLGAVVRTLEDVGFSVDAVQIQVSRARPMPYSQRFEAANPVWIITGTRPIP